MEGAASIALFRALAGALQPQIRANRSSYREDVSQQCRGVSNEFVSSGNRSGRHDAAPEPDQRRAALAKAPAGHRRRSIRPPEKLTNRLHKPSVKRTAVAGRPPLRALKRKPGAKEPARRPRPAPPGPLGPELEAKPARPVRETRTATPKRERPPIPLREVEPRRAFRELERRATHSGERRAEARRRRLLQARQSEALHQRQAREKEEAERPKETPVLVDRIASGNLSGSLPWLRVAGNRITNLAGAPAILRGISVAGLAATQEQGNGANIDFSCVEAILEWGANLIRFDLPWESLSRGFDCARDLDPLVQHAAAGRAYTMLWVAPPREAAARRLWTALVEHYAGEPAVLFHIRDPGSPPTGEGWELWRARLCLMLAELRHVHPRALCFVGGLDHGRDIRGFPLTAGGGAPIPNLVYTVRLLPADGGLSASLRSLARRCPVFVAEWGGGLTDLGWGVQTAQLLRAEAIGWAAAYWNAEPRLTLVRSGRVIPTAFGSVVRHALAVTGERLDVCPPAPGSLWRGDGLGISDCQTEGGIQWPSARNC